MYFSKVLQACTIFLVFLHIPQSIHSQHAEHGQTNLHVQKQTIMPNQKHTTVTGNLNATVTTLKCQSERLKLSAEKKHMFISKLFEKYGNDDKLPFEGFEHMLENIRLGNLSFPDHNITLHKINNYTVFESIHSNHIHIPASSDSMHIHTVGTDDQDTTIQRCLTPQDILKSFYLGAEDEITMSDFVDLCPALIYQLDVQQCWDFSIVTSNDREDHHHGDDEEPKHYQISEIPAKVWGFSCLAAVIISVVGLLGVAVIPLINKVFYKRLLNFLVALAVGALAGDALLHLLPHALELANEGLSHEEMDDHDITGVLKGLCGLGGIYFFFLTEKVLTILTDFKRQQKKKKKQKLSGEGNLYGPSLPQALGELSAVPHKGSFRSTQDNSDKDKKSPKSSHLKLYLDSNEEEKIIMLDQSEFSRSHSHSHSHHGGSFPSSVAAIAWMVILGDGIHNLSDGLAIGAAFGASISSGFSTSIAVFCHELPHEIGDFAMLLKSGMSVKQAIFYNVVSSVMSFIGMVIGVMLGNITSASLWIFAAVAGMFLYIALVDMLPEIKNSENEGTVWKRLFDLFFQSAGMFVGAGIMLVIALYEDKIQIAFDPV